MIQAVIFDMDGLLIDSEPLWQRAEIAIFATVGVPLTREMCIQTMGMRLDEVVAHWYQRYPWDTVAPEHIEELVLREVIRLIQLEGSEKAGVRAALEFVKNKGVKMALCSSSFTAIIETVVSKLGLRRYFDVVHSAEHEPYGKPHPGVYLTAAQKLGVPPTSCLALEDSIAGVIAAKAARMRCIAVPDQQALEDRRFGVADAVLASLAEFDEAVWERMAAG